MNSSRQTRWLHGGILFLASAWVLADLQRVQSQQTASDRTDEFRRKPFDPVQARLDANKDSQVGKHDWPQLGGSRLRNNTPAGKDIPTNWNPGRFDRRTGKWDSSEAVNIKWVAQLGSQSYGHPIVANGKIYVGTNNGAGYLKRYPSAVDLGCLLCFREADGKMLWQYSSEKLPTGRVHDVPLQGICTSPAVEGERLWLVTNRGEVVCLDTEGFHDNEDDGPEKDVWGRLFEAVADLRLEKTNLLAGIHEGELSTSLREQFAVSGVNLPKRVEVNVVTPTKQWEVTAEIGGQRQTYRLDVLGRTLSCQVKIAPAAKEEADLVWKLDMMKELGVSQHNMATCSPTLWRDMLFICTSNGVDETHVNIPAPDAPSFIALDKNTGKVLWTDNSPGQNILHGQWSSPVVGVFDGVPQVMFPGGDGWLYSFRADRWHDGKPELIWKFDANPKESKWILGGRGTRSNLVAVPVIYDGLVYFATGQDPEHGEGQGHLWCVDPTKAGDVSADLVVDSNGHVLPHRRFQAIDTKANGERVVSNPNSAVVWHYDKFDRNGDDKIDFQEEFHRTLGGPTIKKNMLLITDFSGLVHCLNAKTGVPFWSCDMLAACWATPLIVEDKVYVGDEDGDVAILNLSPNPRQFINKFHDRDLEDHLIPLHEINMGNSIYTTPVVANNVLYIAHRTHLFAIAHKSD